jgi:hypothetical protein
MIPERNRTLFYRDEIKRKVRQYKLSNFSDLDNFMVTLPGRTWKQFWDSMERMSDRLEALGIDEEIEGRNV